MDSFEFNKVAGAVLGTLLLAIGSGFVAELIYDAKPAGSAGYALPEPQPEAAGGGAPAAAKAEPLPVRLASASADKGMGAAKKCAACHSFEKGGPNKVGPHLWGVIDRQKAHESGFEYSAGLKEKGGAWTYDELDHFLTNPKAYIAGTKMAFAGITAPQERTDVIAYLRTLADTPAPLPAVEKAAAEGKPADAKPAEAKPADAKAPDAKAPEAKAPEAKAPDAPKAADKPAEAKPADAPKTETKPAETKPTEAKPAEADKPGEAPKPAEAKPEEAKPAAEPPAEKPAQ